MNLTRLLAVEADTMQRFKASLTTGNWPENPEPLVRDENGDYVLHSQVVNAIIDCLNEPDKENIIKHFNNYFGIDFRGFLDS